jgi:phytoene synthase
MAVARLLAVARSLYENARSGIGLLPVGCRAAILASSLIYAEIGAEIERNEYDSVNRRATTSVQRKMFLLARAASYWPFLGPASSAPALAGARFLVEAAAQDRAFSRRSRRTERAWGENFVGVLATFERLRRAERFGN